MVWWRRLRPVGGLFEGRVWGRMSGNRLIRVLQKPVAGQNGDRLQAYRLVLELPLTAREEGSP